jgi:hypothetical protein
MKQKENRSNFLLALQLLVNICHVTIHHFAINLLWTKSARPSALSELLIFAGGLSCIAFVGIVGSGLQRKQKSEDSGALDIAGGNARSVFLILVSFAAEGLTQYLVQ